MKKINRTIMLVLFVSAMAFCLTGCLGVWDSKTEEFGSVVTSRFVTVARAYRSKDVVDGNKYMYAKFKATSVLDEYIITFMYANDSDILTIDDERWDKYETTDVLLLRYYEPENLTFSYGFITKDSAQKPNIIVDFMGQENINLYLNDEEMSKPISMRYIPTAIM